MSRAGLNEFVATSIVGARIVNCADCRQLSTSAVIMIPAAIVLLLFFFGRQTNHSVISLRPEFASYAPKIDATRSKTHCAQASPNVGLPGASTIFSALNISSALSASSGKIGGGMIDPPLFSLSAQSGIAVDGASVIAVLEPSHPWRCCL